MNHINYAQDLSGKVFFISAFKAEWPDHLDGGDYKTHLKQRGAVIINKFDADADYIVVGQARRKGKADLIKKLKALDLEFLDEVSFIQLLRLDLSHKKFTFFGDFTINPGILSNNPEAVLKTVNAQVSDIDEADFLVLGEKRLKGKAALIKKANKLIAQGSPLRIINEHDYLPFIALNSDTSQQLDFLTLALRLRNVINPNKINRAIEMLQEESYNLYSNVTEDEVAGIVESQTSYEQYYAPWINKNGEYSCYDESMSSCMGLQGHICKHILVLLLGLAQKGEIDLERVLEWATTARSESPLEGEERSAVMLLRYKGVETGEVDWRPTETIPEDFYIF